MQKLLITQLALCSLLFFSCKKQVKETTPKESIVSKNAGTLSVEINGKAWSDFAVLANYSKSKNDLFTISVYTFSGTLTADQLYVSNIRLKDSLTYIHDVKTFQTDNSWTICTAGFGNGEDDLSYNTYDVINDSSKNRLDKNDCKYPMQYTRLNFI